MIEIGKRFVIDEAGYVRDKTNGKAVAIIREDIWNERILRITTVTDSEILVKVN